MINSTGSVIPPYTLGPFTTIPPFGIAALTSLDNQPIMLCSGTISAFAFLTVSLISFSGNGLIALTLIRPTLKPSSCAYLQASLACAAAQPEATTNTSASGF